MELSETGSLERIEVSKMIKLSGPKAIPIQDYMQQFILYTDITSYIITHISYKIFNYNYYL